MSDYYSQVMIEGKPVRLILSNKSIENGVKFFTSRKLPIKNMPGYLVVGVVLYEAYKAKNQLTGLREVLSLADFIKYVIDIEVSASGYKSQYTFPNIPFNR